MRFQPYNIWPFLSTVVNQVLIRSLHRTISPSMQFKHSSYTACLPTPQVLPHHPVAAFSPLPIAAHINTKPKKKRPSVYLPKDSNPTLHKHDLNHNPLRRTSNLSLPCLSERLSHRLSFKESRRPASTKMLKLPLNLHH